MTARSFIVPAIVLAFAYWINQVNVQVTVEVLVPEIIAAGGGYSGYADTSSVPVRLAQGQPVFW